MPKLVKSYIMPLRELAGDRADRLEIIVVNSGSEQNEEAIVKEFQKKYSNIKYIKTDQRETVYAAWNRGVKAASGKYITNANTDDRRRADACEQMRLFLTLPVFWRPMKAILKR
ncbi:MAG: hypothetical protein SRB1_00642 [Desulfobacteraceae bacterium Eth-SRB1]|nr:MAG: hypothetical protein SRB1_00642 [Desulfobacteraceae bacterium Eth-SRB1]